MLESEEGKVVGRVDVRSAADGDEHGVRTHRLKLRVERYGDHYREPPSGEAIVPDVRVADVRRTPDDARPEDGVRDVQQGCAAALVENLNPPVHVEHDVIRTHVAVAVGWQGSRLCE